MARTDKTRSGVDVWTNGVDAWVARNAEDAAGLESAMLTAAGELGALARSAAWDLAADPLTLTLDGVPRTAPRRAWALANDRGALAFAGELADGRRAP